MNSSGTMLFATITSAIGNAVGMVIWGWKNLLT